MYSLSKYGASATAPGNWLTDAEDNVKAVTLPTKAEEAKNEVPDK